MRIRLSPLCLAFLSACGDSAGSSGETGQGASSLDGIDWSFTTSTGVVSASSSSGSDTGEGTTGTGAASSGDGTTGAASDTTGAGTSTGEEAADDDSTGSAGPGGLKFTVELLDLGEYVLDLKYEPSGEAFALAIDGDGRPHVSHHAPDIGAQIYRSRTFGDQWLEDSMFTDPKIFSYVPRDHAIAVDNVGHAHIVIAGEHHDKAMNYSNSVHYQRTDGLDWFYRHPLAAAEVTSQVPASVAMAHDGAGVVHVIFAGEVPEGDVHERRPIYGRLAAGKWKFTELGAEQLPNYQPRATALALDGKGRPHVAWVTPGEGGAGAEAGYVITYGLRVGESWQLELAEDQLFLRGFIALAIGPGDRPVLAFADDDDSSVYISERVDGAWVRDQVEVGADGQLGWGISVAVDPSGQPHVAHIDRTDRHLRYARRVDGLWDTYEIAKNFSEGFDPPYVTRLATELAIDALGRGHILVGGLDLHYVRVIDPNP